MFRNQELKAVVAVACFASAALVCGCSSSGASTRSDSSAAPVTSAEAAASPAPTDNLTATEAAAQAAGANTVSSSGSDSGAGAGVPADEIKSTAPMQYTVKRGDTLWGIASMFLKDPWLWPEIWYVNPKIENPHLIFPGDVLALAYGKDGRAQVSLQQGGAARLEPRLRSTPVESAIPTIPYASIAAFLSHPALLDSSQVRGCPHVVGLREDHQIGGAGNEIYVEDLTAAIGARYTVMHVGEKLKDPEDHSTLGYQGIFVGTAVVETQGNPAKLRLLDTERETLRGDCVYADEGTAPLNFTPRAPTTAVHGAIVSVLDNVFVVGKDNIVAINRGKGQGVDAGTVLAVDQRGDVVTDPGAAGYDVTGWRDSFGHKVKLPNERTGTLLVFKSYDHLSYALVVGASGPMRVADVVRSP